MEKNSNQRESIRLLNCLAKLILHLSLRSVSRQVQQTRAHVSNWQTMIVLHRLNVYFDSLHALNWNSIRASEEQQKLFLLLDCEFVKNFPKHSNGGVAGGVAVFVLCILLKLVPVVVFISNNDCHQLVRLEKFHHSTATNFHETVKESPKLLLHRLVENVIDIEINVLFSVKVINVRGNSQAKSIWQLTCFRSLLEYLIRLSSVQLSCSRQKRCV
jgi:hypothetical protein